MKNEAAPQRPYGPEWFKKRAFESIHPLGPHEWDFSDSLLLYTEAGEEEYEHVQDTTNPYHELVTKPEHEYLAEVAEQIMAELPDEFEFIDLGPGTEGKEQFFFDAAKKLGKKFKYVPVDISKAFLSGARENARKQRIEVTPVQASFEELPSPGSSSLPRFVSLGFTYSNYHPKEAIRLLRGIAGEKGYVFINSQLRERTDTAKLQEIYAGMKGMFDGKLAFLGLSPSDVSELETTDGIQIWCRVLNSNPQLEAKGVKSGDRMLIFQSLRPSKESHEQDMAKTPHTTYDTGGSFVATLLTPEVR